MDPRNYPEADVPIASSDIESSPTLADLIETFDATNQNERKALSLLTLLTASPVLRLAATEITADGAIDLDASSYVELNKSGGALAVTIAAPQAGQLLVITQTDGGTSGHTVTLTSGTYDGTNNVATFNAQAETLVLFGISATRFVIVENIGAVALS